MNDSDNTIECNSHGTTEATFLCSHLSQGKNLGFNLSYDPEDPDVLYPDAWCDECEAIFEKAGGWTEEAEKLSGLQIFCTKCYENIREKNWIENDNDFHDLICSSFQYTDEKQNLLQEEYKIDSYDRWDWDQEQGTLIFSHEGEPQVEAEIHFAGSFSTNSNSWMWAWANSSLLEKVKAVSRKAKELGEKHNFLKLTAGYWSGTEVDGWEMTSILANEMGAVGVYRTPSDNGFSYMIITKVKWVNKNWFQRLFS